jgi:hypothetical protein
VSKDKTVASPKQGVRRQQMTRRNELIIRTETTEILSVRRSLIRTPAEARCTRCGQHIEPDSLQTPAQVPELEFQESDNETE